MKKVFLTVLFTALIMALGSSAKLAAQDEPKPKKDSVNMDTITKPTTYYAIEDDKSLGTKEGKGTASTIVIIAGAVIIAGGVLYSLLRKKKQ